jgi:hypothetical protein
VVGLSADRLAEPVPDGGFHLTGHLGDGRPIGDADPKLHRDPAVHDDASPRARQPQRSEGLPEGPLFESKNPIGTEGCPADEVGDGAAGNEAAARDGRMGSHGGFDRPPSDDRWGKDLLDRRPGRAMAVL